jgi:hypothetical protein
MLFTKSLITTSLSTIVAIAALPINTHASFIDPNISVKGTLTFNSNGLETGFYSGSMFSTVDGIEVLGDTTDTAITNTQDGFGHTATLNINDDNAESSISGSYQLDLENTSLDDYLLTFKIDFFQAIDTSGLANTENALYSNVLSGLPFGDFSSTEPTGASGDSFFFDVNLNAESTDAILADFFLGGAFSDTAYTLESYMFIALDSFSNQTNPGGCNPITGGEGCVGPGPSPVSEPGSLILLMAGLVAVRFARKKS